MPKLAPQTAAQALDEAQLVVEALCGRGFDCNAVVQSVSGPYWRIEAKHSGRTFRIASRPSPEHGRAYDVQYAHGTGWMLYASYTAPGAAFMALANELV